MKATKAKTGERKPDLKGWEAAKIVARENWLERLEMNKFRPDDFLGFFTQAGIEALCVAACDKSAPLAERASAGYRLADAIKLAADSLMKAFPVCSGNESLPDCGFHKATVTAVEAMHVAARKSPAAFQWLPHEFAWPILVAPDGKIIARCISADEMKCGPIFSAAGFPVKRTKRGKGKTVSYGGIWPELAAKMFYRAGFGRAKIPRRRAWAVVKVELKSSRAEIMRQPHIQKWAAQGTNAGSKNSVIWSRLQAKVQRALAVMLKS